MKKKAKVVILITVVLVAIMAVFFSIQRRVPGIGMLTLAIFMGAMAAANVVKYRIDRSEATKRLINMYALAFVIDIIAAFIAIF